MKFLALSAAALLAGCASITNVQQEKLADCSREYSEHFQQSVPELSPDLVSRVFDAAEKWAVERCYLPCRDEMCGAITSRSDGAVTVLVTSKELYERREENVFVLGPEAEVVISETTLEPLGETLWHSGCRWRDKNCKLKTDD